MVMLSFLLAQSQAWGAPSQEVRGTVKDRSGAVIARAQVLLRVDGEEFSRVTQPDGSFVFSGISGASGSLIVTAPGFATSTTPWRAGQNDLVITLVPATVQQSLDVTATRTAVIPTGVDNLEAQPDAVVVNSDQLQQWGALATDDKLRNVVGFSLLRRSGSQTANPTSQGVSLRGLGANGASRALVLTDGIPLNDPFGGWIFWGRVPQASLDQVQIVPGGVSALYGNDALGGVINLETRPAVQTDGFIEGSYGNENAPFGSGWGAVRIGPWAVVASGEGFRTDGYIAVPKDVRGSVDTPVASQYGSGKLARGAIVRRPRPHLLEWLDLRRRPPERHAAAGQRHHRTATGVRYRLEQFRGRSVYAAAVRRNRELPSDVFFGRRQSQQRVADQHSVRAGAADGPARAVVEADRQPLHVAGGT